MASLKPVKECGKHPRSLGPTLSGWVRQVEYRRLFDYRYFEPAETQVDHDSYVERRMVYLPQAEALMAPKPRAPEVTPEERAMSKILKLDAKPNGLVMLSDDEIEALGSLDAA